MIFLAAVVVKFRPISKLNRSHLLASRVYCSEPSIRRYGYGFHHPFLGRPPANGLRTCDRFGLSEQSLIQILEELFLDTKSLRILSLSNYQRVMRISWSLQFSSRNVGQQKEEQPKSRSQCLRYFVSHFLAIVAFLSHASFTSKVLNRE
jgi:hypothetical protein